MRPDQVSGRQRGAVTAELVLVTPLLFLLVLLIVQFAVWMHATHVARVTAGQALAAARSDGGSAAAGEAEAQALLDQLGRTVLTDPQVTVTRDAADVQVVIDGRAEVVVPGLPLPIHVVLQGPIERFSTPEGR